MIERLLLYVNIFLLTLAIGINTHTFYAWYSTPEEEFHSCSSAPAEANPAKRIT